LIKTKETKKQYEKMKMDRKKKKPIW